ncbi:MAG: hypothetical protein F6K17_28045, partial [Okeania sp. SIO3C4]|nr:hypothetical protein [Okeania sp. SIO3C4]
MLIGEECNHAVDWLATAEEKKLKPEPTGKHREFIGKSEEKLVASQKFKKRLKLLQRALMAGITVALIAALALAYTTRQALERAEIERINARRLYVKASANNLVALARQLEQKNPTIAMRLAEKADQQDRNEGVIRALYDIYKNNILYRTIGTHQDKINTVQYLKSANLLVTASDDQTAKVWDLKSGLRLNLEGHSAAVNSADLSRKGMLF